MPISNIFILGGGICGLATAIALSKTHSPSDDGLKITIYELRDRHGITSMSGGAVGLTPSALRHLDYLGVQVNDLGTEVGALELFANQSGTRMGAIDFSGPGPDGSGSGNGYDGFKGARVMRKGLHAALLDAVEKEGVEVVFGKKVTGLDESDDENVRVRFEDGTNAVGDLAIGTDGIHSATRMKFVEPDSVPGYSGLATAQSFVPVSAVRSHIHFKDTAVNVARKGSLLTTFCERRREMIYLAAVMETEDRGQIDRDGWKVKAGKGRDGQDAVKKDIGDRFNDSAFSCVREMVDGAGDWYMYPVYTLPPGGRWCTGRVMLLGDAAHAMPPQGESIGLALEDAVLFSRVLARHNTKYTEENPRQAQLEAFKTYENLRRSRIDEAYREASMRWESAKDSGFIAMKMKELIFPWVLWWTAGRRDKAYMYDTRDIEIP